MRNEISQKELEKLINERSKHKGKWLTQEAAMEYCKRAQKIQDEGRLDIGMRRKLRQELQEEYGLLEIEAINIINGYRWKEYVNKYHRIKNLIPLNRSNPKKNGEEENEI